MYHKPINFKRLKHIHRTNRYIKIQNEKQMHIDSIPKPDKAYSIACANELYLHRYYREAINWLDKAIAVDPMYKEAWVGKASALFQLKDYKDAIVCYDKVIEMNEKDRMLGLVKQVHCFN